MVRQQPLLFALKSHPLMRLLCEKLPTGQGRLQIRNFPDGESHLKIISAVKDRHCMVLADLSHPDGKFLPLVFLGETLKELGAKSVGLVAPYLSYMRQDRRFVEGEAVTSRIFASLVSAHFDWLVTVDPHLHRYHSLDEIYTIPSRVVQGAPVLADWLAGEKNIFLVGPDAESEQWVSRISELCGHPFVIGEKQRHGDRSVTITLPDLTPYQGSAGVIIDDVIASGHTVLECLRALKAGGIDTVDCACIHGIFADNIDRVLLDSGLRQLLSCNTVLHETNLLDISTLLVTPVRESINQKYKGKHDA